MDRDLGSQLSIPQKQAVGVMGPLNSIDFSPIFALGLLFPRPNLQSGIIQLPSRNSVELYIFMKDNNIK